MQYQRTINFYETITKGIVLHEVLAIGKNTGTISWWSAFEGNNGYQLLEIDA